MARPIKNNADYFSHDADMRNDPKVKALRRKYKLEGYAVWCMLLESITDSENFRLSYEIDIIAGDYDLEPEKLLDIITYCLTLGLLQIDVSANEIYCLQLEKRLEPLLSKRKRDRTVVSASDNTQSKVKESKVYIEIGEKRELFIQTKSNYANQKPLRIYQLEKHFDGGQLELLKSKGWIYFDDFMNANPARVFNDTDHLYNAFRDFSIKYKPPQKQPNKYETAEFNKGLWTLEAWEKEYNWALKRDPEFRKHFGYDEHGISKTMGSNGKS